MTILRRQLDIYWRDLRVTLVYPVTEKQLLNASIHPFSVPTYLYRVVRKLAPIPWRDWVHPGQVASPSQDIYEMNLQIRQSESHRLLIIHLEQRTFCFTTFTEKHAAITVFLWSQPEIPRSPSHSKN